MYSIKQIKSLAEYLKTCGAHELDLDYLYSIYKDKTTKTFIDFLNGRYNVIRFNFYKDPAPYMWMGKYYITYQELAAYLKIEYEDLPLHVNNDEVIYTPIKYVIRWRLTEGV